MAFLYGDVMQPRFRCAVITLAHAHNRNEARIPQHVNARIHQLSGTASGIRVHGRKLFLCDLLHPHPAGMKSEPFRLDLLARTKHRWNFSLHRGIRTGNDLTDAKSSSFHIQSRILPELLKFGVRISIDITEYRGCNFPPYACRAHNISRISKEIGDNAKGW